MSDVIDSDGFRSNVGIVLMHRDQVFLGRRTGGRGWALSPGGGGAREGPQRGLYRELDEEIGLAQSSVDLIGHTDGWLRYRLPSRYIRRNQHPVCIGQKQCWFLLRLKSTEGRVDFCRTSEPEFDQWRWAPYWEPVREVICFKRPVYARALEELSSLAFPQGRPALPPWWDKVTAGGGHPVVSAPAH